MIHDLPPRTYTFGGQDREAVIGFNDETGQLVAKPAGVAQPEERSEFTVRYVPPNDGASVIDAIDNHPEDTEAHVVNDGQVVLRTRSGTHLAYCFKERSPSGYGDAAGNAIDRYFYVGGVEVMVSIDGAGVRVQVLKEGEEKFSESL